MLLYVTAFTVFRLFRFRWPRNANRYDIISFYVINGSVSFKKYIVIFCSNFLSLIPKFFWPNHLCVCLAMLVKGGFLVFSNIDFILNNIFNCIT